MGELKPLPIPEGRWDVASVDFIVELPESQGHDAIMVVVDSVGKRAHFIETHNGYCTRSRTAVSTTCLEVTWTPVDNDFQPRPTVCRIIHL
jgi:hypothetical protein